MCIICFQMSDATLMMQKIAGLTCKCALCTRQCRKVEDELETSATTSQINDFKHPRSMPQLSSLKLTETSGAALKLSEPNLEENVAAEKTVETQRCGDGERFAKIRKAAAG